MKRQRQALILRELESSSISSQDQLVEVLRRDGFNVSQTTVSRDLKELGVFRRRDADGSLRYGVADSRPNRAADDSDLRRMASQFLLQAEATGNIVVVKTTPGNAQGLAASLDAAVIKGVAGTVAGDDTVLVVCSAGVESRRISEKLRDYALGEG